MSVFPWQSKAFFLIGRCGKIRYVHSSMKWPRSGFAFHLYTVRRSALAIWGLAY